MVTNLTQTEHGGCLTREFMDSLTEKLLHLQQVIQEEGSCCRGTQQAVQLTSCM